MEDLMELRTMIEQGRYAEALVLLGEMDEMDRDDKINKIGSYIEIVLLHLIKRHAEQRTTRSWDVSIANAVQQIVFVNKRRKAGGYYLSIDDLAEVILERYEIALRLASLEVFEGEYTVKRLATEVSATELQAEALQLIQDAQAKA